MERRIATDRDRHVATILAGKDPHYQRYTETLNMLLEQKPDFVLALWQSIQDQEQKRLKKRLSSSEGRCPK